MKYRFLPVLLFMLTASVAFAQPPQWGFPPEERTPKVTFAANEVATADWGAPFIKAPEAHEKNPLAKGKGVKVAILDNGCDVKHPAFTDRIKGIYNATTKTVGKCAPGDHGTHVADTVLHVAPECELYIVQVLSGNSGSVVDIAHGIDYAVSVMKVDVINLSLGGPQADQWIPPAFQRANEAGVILNVAAGNDGPGENTEGYPARYPQSISTAAHDKNRFVANFSSRGPTVFQCLPGKDITAAWPNGQQATIDGTSMATPHGSGASASWIATHPEVTKKDRPAKYREELRNALSRPTQRNTSSGYGVLDMTKFTPDSGTTPTEPTPPTDNTVTFTEKDLNDAGLMKLALTGVSKFEIRAVVKVPSPMPKLLPVAPTVKPKVAVNAQGIPIEAAPPGKRWSKPGTLSDPGEWTLEDDNCPNGKCPLIPRIMNPPLIPVFPR